MYYLRTYYNWQVPFVMLSFEWNYLFIIFFIQKCSDLNSQIQNPSSNDSFQFFSFRSKEETFKK